MAKPGHIYHWKHGWIPITPRAAMVKAKGRRGLADKYMHHFGIEDHRQEGRDRRQGGSVSMGEKRSHEHRGTFEYKPGTKTRDYPDRNPYGATGGPGPEHGPKSAADAFKMRKHELEPHAKAGNPHAQAELDRRAAKRAGDAAPAPKADRPPVPVRPSKDFRPGHDIPRAEPKAAPEVPKVAPNAAERAKNAETMHGTGSAEHLRALEMENREIEHGLPSGHRLEARRVNDPVQGTFRGVLNAHYVGEDRIGAVVPKAGAFNARYKGSTIGQFATRDEAHKAMASHHAKLQHQAGGTGELDPADVEAEDVRISGTLPTGETVSGSVGKRFMPNNFGGRDTVQVVKSTHYKDVADPTSLSGGVRRTHVGMVSGDGKGKFEAEHRLVPIGRKTYTYNDLGTFDTREAAHKAISEADAAHQAKVAASAERKAKAAAAKLDKLSGVAGPNGTTWQPFVLESDGTWAGSQAAKKAKMSFKAGDHTVVIETAMSAEQAKGFLADVTNATERAAPNLKGPVKFLVPSGERWTGKNGGTVGAYVHVNGTTVHVNPKVADNTHAASFQASAEAGHFVPAAKGIPPREYTILHELGHVVDNQHHHTPHESVNSPSSLFGGSRDRWQPGAQQFHQDHGHDGHSEYGKDSAAEGYAEAFAQWSIDGSGKHKVADAYAEHYGWTAPAAPARASVNPFGDEAGISNPAFKGGSGVLADGYEWGPGGVPRKKATARTPEQFAKAADDFERQFGLGKYAKTGQVSDGFHGNLGGGIGSPFDAQHSAGLARADAARTKPLSSTVKTTREALATLPADVRDRILKGRSIDSMSPDELRAVLRAVIDYAKSKRKG